MELENDVKFWEKMYNDSDRIFWNQHNKLCKALGMSDHEAYTTSNNDVIKKVEELNSEVLKLRAKLIENEECPDCGSYLQNTEIGLPDNSVTFIYVCCGCNKKWLYYGKELS
jgi:DNA-directed RNA polymerase subunit M/transcription elongation factor TFIIS